MVTLGIANARYGDRYHFVDDEYIQSSKLKAAIKKTLSSYSGGSRFSDIPYAQITASRIRHNQVDYTYKAAVKSSLRRSIRGLHIWARSNAASVLRRSSRSKNRTGYGYFAWTASLLRKAYIYRYFLKHGKKPI